MSTITRTDIAQHVVEASVAGAGFTTEQIDAITDAVLDAAPLDTWRLTEALRYESEALGTEDFWAIVEAITA
ncbi:MAG: hypothetical protein QM662_16760 [Gordonia sp. (in: high G+C Gram-positive bacteria)]